MSALLRVLLVDDEDFARLRLRSLLEECAQLVDVAAIGEASHAGEALAWLAAHACDLVLLDIHMPGQDGLALAAQLRQGAGPAVVFVTAHTEHAVQAFDLAAIDYLTKPVRRDRLQVALQRAASLKVPVQNSLQGHGSAQTAPPLPVDNVPMLVVSDMGRKVRVPLADVLYLKAELKYVTLRTATHTYVLDDALTDLEQRLGAAFLRVHRNALVARHAMRALEKRLLSDDEGEVASEGWMVRVAPVNEWLVVSRRQVSAVKEAIAQGGV